MTPGDIVQRGDGGDVYLVTRVTKKVIEGRRLHPALPNGIGDVEVLPLVKTEPNVTAGGIWFGDYTTTPVTYTIIRKAR